MIHNDFGNNRMATQAMRFYPTQPDIIACVGDKTVVMYFCPAIYVQGPSGEREFDSRFKADIYMAAEIRRLRYNAGFNAYCDGKPEPSDADENRGWWNALNAEARTKMAHEEFIDMEHFRQQW